MDIEELKITASLAHLNMEQSQLEQAFPAFQQMLDYFAAMQDADSDEKTFGTNIRELLPQQQSVNSSYFRTDAVSGGVEAIEKGVLVGNAGDNDGQFIIMPNVL
ncbi:hypothetical protein FACS189494_00640 [Spirochaetia bacterium]|nr:hypothetical protein FACS189494_00640 [Spirochaetia bacterium]